MKMTELTECSINVWSGDNAIVLDVKRGFEKIWFEVDLGEAKALVGSMQHAIDKAEAGSQL